MCVCVRVCVCVCVCDTHNLFYQKWGCKKSVMIFTCLSTTCLSTNVLLG